MKSIFSLVDKFNKDQLFILFAFEDSGSNLESVEVNPV